MKIKKDTLFSRFSALTLILCISTLPACGGSLIGGKILFPPFAPPVVEAPAETSAAAPEVPEETSDIISPEIPPEVSKPEPLPLPSSEPLAMSALAWENSSKLERKQWSQYLMTLLTDEWSALLKGSDDIHKFCPRYFTLSTHDRANVWAQLVAAITKYESGYNPSARMRETTMGTDPVTKKPVYSEGLLQLSYQDITGWKFCKFNWSKDRLLSAKDPKKTILNPYINLHCGVGILAKQVQRSGKIMLGRGAYWAVIKTNNRHNKISQIQTMVRSLRMCN